MNNFTITEQTLLELMSKGDSTQRILDELKIDREKFKSIIRELFKKLNAKNRVEIVVNYIKLTKNN